MNLIDKIWGLFENLGIATQSEMELVTNINGYTEETMMDILYARTALRSLEQVADEFDVDLEEWGFTEDEIGLYSYAD